MKYYLFTEDGFHWGTFATFADAYEEMESLAWDDVFITTNPYPWPPLG